MACDCDGEDHGQPAPEDCVCELSHEDELGEEQILIEEEELLTACRVCGCTELAACYPPCFWAEPDLCSACVSGIAS